MVRVTAPVPAPAPVPAAPTKLFWGCVNFVLYVEKIRTFTLSPQSAGIMNVAVPGGVVDGVAALLDVVRDQLEVRRRQDIY